VRRRLGALATLGALACLLMACATDPSVANEPSSAAPFRTSGAPPPSDASRGQPNRELIDAAWQNDVGRARALIKDGADVNAKDASEQSAFLIAASEGYLELLELTLDSGADVASLDSYRGTALIRAADRGHSDIVARLVQTKINVNHVNDLGWTALLEAVILGDGSGRYVQTVRILLEAGADPDLADRDGVTALEHAERRGYSKIAAELRG
jgi:hypothetical protein